MSYLTYLVSAEIRDGVSSISGKVLTRPALIYTDGLNITYAIDVDIGQEGPINENGDLGIIPLRNVPLAQNNRELIYAEIGMAVNLTRTATGSWEVSSLSKIMPSTFNLVPVTLPDDCSNGFQLDIGAPTTIGIEVKFLTYGEIATYGEYGTTPYGAVGVFNNGQLTEIRSA